MNCLIETCTNEVPSHNLDYGTCEDCAVRVHFKYRRFCRHCLAVAMTEAARILNGEMPQTVDFASEGMEIRI